MISVSLIDYGSGNLHSAARALAAAGAHVQIVQQAEQVHAAERLVLPGVGHFADCAQALRAPEGLIAALNEAVHQRGVPFFGICVGMQLMARAGFEDGETPGLGWIEGRVERLLRPRLRIPHVGWNEITVSAHPVLQGLGAAPHVYFTHSYAMVLDDARDEVATTDYGGAFTAAVAKDNLFGAQFHPEKSQAAGLQILSNFLKWTP
jgi:glutamine amidotransferase